MDDKPLNGSMIGVVLVEPRDAVRAGLKIWLDDEPGISVDVQAASSTDALQEIDAMPRRPSVVALVSLGLDGPQDAYSLMRTVRERFPSFSVLAVGADADADSISHALFCGADGYVDKGVKPEEFIEGIRKAARGELVMIGAKGGP